MPIEIGKVYKINSGRLKYYCDEHNWVFDKLNIGYVTTDGCYVDGFRTPYVCYTVKEHLGYYPEDCLIDLRELKLKKILCQ